MKYLFTILLGLVLFSVSATSQTLTVHEWGTFTTLHGSTGGTLSGLYFEEEQLPSFVYHFPGFSPDPSIAQNGYMPCKDVTVKMETPVLYFYSPVERSVNIHVDFPHGAITQWYPNRTGGEQMPTGSFVDFGQSERNGSIDWKATVLDPMSKTPLSQPSAPFKWTDPRNTESNLVQNPEGETEKFLFYRGLANFPLPVEVKFISDVELLIRNTSGFKLPYLFIFDNTSGNASIWSETSLAPNESKTIMSKNGTWDLTGFRKALQTAGLTLSEASAMLNTWTDGYFGTTGFKVFWIVPREMTDQILPISISPKPDTLERVLVAKTEILTPAFEEQLVNYYKYTGNLDQWSNDRYRLAYMQRVKEIMATAGVSNSSGSSQMNIIPNPATNMIRIEGASAESSIAIRNILGETVISTKNNSSSLDIHTLPDGLYFVTISDGIRHETLKLMKR